MFIIRTGDASMLTVVVASIFIRRYSLLIDFSMNCTSLPLCSSSSSSSWSVPAVGSPVAVASLWFLLHFGLSNGFGCGRNGSELPHVLTKTQSQLHSSVCVCSSVCGWYTSMPPERRVHPNQNLAMAPHRSAFHSNANLWKCSRVHRWVLTAMHTHHTHSVIRLSAALSCAMLHKAHNKVHSYVLLVICFWV